MLTKQKYSADKRRSLIFSALNASPVPLTSGALADMLNTWTMDIITAMKPAQAAGLVTWADKVGYSLTVKGKAEYASFAPKAGLKKGVKLGPRTKPSPTISTRGYLSGAIKPEPAPVTTAKHKTGWQSGLSSLAAVAAEVEPSKTTAQIWTTGLLDALRDCDDDMTAAQLAHKIGFGITPKAARELAMTLSGVVKDVRDGQYRFSLKPEPKPVSAYSDLAQAAVEAMKVRSVPIDPQRFPDTALAQANKELAQLRAENAELRKQVRTITKFTVAIPTLGDYELTGAEWLALRDEITQAVGD